VTRTGPVLLAYDGSEGSATAIAVAGSLLRGRAAVVCYVVPGAGEPLATEGAALAGAAGFDATAKAENEPRRAWRGLLNVAARSGASIVVTGAHGRSGIRRAVLGSVSTALLHHSSLPVLVVPATATEPATEAPLLLCYDGSDGARRAIAEAARQFCSRTALALHVWESWMVEAPGLAGASGTVQRMAGELDQVASEQSKDRAAEGVQAAERAGFEAEGLSRRATRPAWRTVLDVAEERGCAVIVVGSRGLSGVYAALGSVSNGIAHHSRRPVLVVPWKEER
jgi:nucleotide-binding universal stress UspA family protein